MRDATMDVIDWIRSQYAVIESAARLATPGPWHVSSQGRAPLQDWYVSSPHSLVLTGNHECGDDFLMVEYDRRDAEHVALHDPRFVLTDLRSKQALLAEHHPAPDWEATYLRDSRGGPHKSQPVLAGHCRCQAADDTRRGVWPCTPVLWLAQPLAGRPGWRVEWTLLTSEDPEPGHDVTVQDCHGDKWRRTDGNFNGGGGANWQQEKPEDSDPESWTRVAGDYGPIRIVPEPVDPRAPRTLWLTGEWPEPAVGTVVETRGHARWERRWDAQGACWIHLPAAGEATLGTRSWRVLTDSHGPVKMVSS
jgi:hypothetical protein